MGESRGHLTSAFFERLKVGRLEPIFLSWASCTNFRAKLCAKLPLDKIPKMWYNSNVVKGRGKDDGARKNLYRFTAIKKFFEEISKNPLTNLQKYDIIYMSRGERGLLPMTEREERKK